MFYDRQDAGRQLAQRLVHLREEQPIVMGLPRGGVVVAAEVARELEAPLEVLIVRKLGAPHQPELALGAVTGGEQPRHVLNQDLIDSLGVDDEYLNAEIARQTEEIARRESFYRRGRPAVSIANRAVIVIDDGIATGATVRAGLTALRQSNPSRLVLAVPVAPIDALPSLQAEVDELVCLHAPAHFMAVGRFYTNFDQTTDEEVISVLDEAAARAHGPASPA